MNQKPLPPHKAKQLLDTFRRSMKDLEVYELDALSEQQRNGLLNEPHSWIVIGKSKWS
jgi:hypothetical protein